jgi:circadian clock protein KaiC
LQFLKEAAGRGEQCALYSFEEEVQSMLHRCANVNIPAESMVSRGTLSLVKVEPLRYSADEFAHLVRRDVVEKGTRIVMIDGVCGYRLSVRGEVWT